MGDESTTGSAGTGKGSGAGGQTGGQTDLEEALRFERAKCDVLLNEVIALEDELANRDLAQFGDVISDSTRDFWREQLLTNRGPATRALKDMVANRKAGAGGAGDTTQVRRPLHNRAAARAPAGGSGGGAAGTGEPAGEAAKLAAKIRNRAHEIARGDGVPFAIAFRRAEREVTL